MTRRQTLDLVVNLCCEQWSVTRKDLLSHDRHEHLVIPRHAAWCLLRDRGFRNDELGRLFKRDHSAITHGWKTFQNKLFYPSVRERFERVKQRLAA